MPKTVHQWVAEARQVVPVIGSGDLQTRIQEDPNLLVIDVRDAADIQKTGIIPGAIAISGAMLPIRADLGMPEAMQDQRLHDRSRPIVVTCGMGIIASLAAQTLHEMGFSQVSILEGGTLGWIAAGLPVEGKQDPS